MDIADEIGLTKGAMHLAMYGEYDRNKFVEVILASFDLLFSSLSN